MLYMKKLKLREMISCALFIALITIGTFVRIPVGTDVYTLQFLFTLLAGLILGARLGAVAVTAYIVLGLMGHVENLVSYVGRKGDVVRMGHKGSSGTRLSDDEVLLLAKQITHLDSSSEVRSLDKKGRPRIMKQLAENGATTRQIASLFGVGKSTVARVLSKA
jgi:hypothetical protein